MTLITILYPMLLIFALAGYLNGRCNGQNMA